jgi:vacuolar-type H+-ATPase subunit I/STV1
MNTFAKHLILTSLLTSSIFASSSNYLLLNDMKLAKEEIAILDQMTQKVTKENKEEFSKILEGLINSDSSLNLRGTEIIDIKDKLIEIQKLWESKKDTIKSETSSLNDIKNKINKVVKIYNKSYDKYLKKQKFSALVTQHMNQTEPNSQVLALYEKF